MTSRKIEIVHTTSACKSVCELQFQFRGFKVFSGFYYSSRKQTSSSPALLVAAVLAIWLCFSFVETSQPFKRRLRWRILERSDKRKDKQKKKKKKKSSQIQVSSNSLELWSHENSTVSG